MSTYTSMFHGCGGKCINFTSRPNQVHADDRKIELYNMRSSAMPMETLRAILNKLIDVHQLHIRCYSVLDSGDRMFLLASFLRRCQNLQEFSFEFGLIPPTEWAKNYELGGALLDALTGLPRLKILKLKGVKFSSAGVIEEFFANAHCLEILHLHHILIEDDGGGTQGSQLFVADAFGRGLSRLPSLEQVLLVKRGIDSRLYEEALFGLAKLNTLKRLNLVIGSSDKSSSAFDTSEGRAERTLIQASTSLKFVCVSAVTAGAQAQTILGAARSDSLEEFVLMGTRDDPPLAETEEEDDAPADEDDDDDDEEEEEDEDDDELDVADNLETTVPASPGEDSMLASAFKQLFSCNSSLHILRLQCLRLGEMTEESLINGLATRTMPLEELALNEVDLERESELMYQLCTIKEVSLERGKVAKAPGNRLTELLPTAKIETFRALSTPFADLGGLRVLRRMSRPIKKLVLFDCDLKRSMAGTLSHLVRNSKDLEMLVLSGNEQLCSTAQNVREIVDVVCKHPTLRTLELDNTGLRPQDCAESLGRLLEESQLTELSLGDGNCAIRGEAVAAITAGLCKNTTLKVLSLPFVGEEHYRRLGEVLTENGTLEKLSVDGLEHLHKDEEGDASLREEDEESVLAFIEAIPRMKGLRRLGGILDCESSERLEAGLEISMMKNMCLVHIGGEGLADEARVAQFYASLNYFGRSYVFGDKQTEETATLRVVWPHILSRMTRSEDPLSPSALYYFLKKRVDLLPRGDQPPRKRKVACGGEQRDDNGKIPAGDAVEKS